MMLQRVYEAVGRTEQTDCETQVAHSGLNGNARRSIATHGCDGVPRDLASPPKDCHVETFRCETQRRVSANPQLETTEHNRSKDCSAGQWYDVLSRWWPSIRYGPQEEVRRYRRATDDRDRASCDDGDSRLHV